MKKALSGLLALAIILSVFNLSALSISAVNKNVSTRSLTTVPAGYTGIYSAAQLNAVRNNLSGKFILMQDIDLSQATSYGGAYYYSGKGWQPIGSNETAAFTGTFDGNGYEVYGMRITSDNLAFAGLFGVSSGKIMNLNMTDSYINSDLSDTSSNLGSVVYAGGIAALNKGSMTDCSNSGTVAVNVMTYNAYNYDLYVYSGGIAGSNHGGTIMGCTNSGSVSAYASRSNYSDTKAVNAGAGGIAGRNTGSPVALIDQCFNEGTVSATADGGYSANCKSWSGGIAGSNGGVTSNCYNTGSVSANAHSDWGYSWADGGGIAGFCNGSISTSYNITSSLDADQSSSGGGIYTYLGNITGYLNDEAGSITFCYYLNNTYDGTGYGDDAAVGCTNTQMKTQSTYVGFDFESVWEFDTSDGYWYPQFKKIVVAPEAPFYPQAVSVSYNSVRISWIEPEGADGYEIWRSVSAGGTFTQIMDTVSASYTDTALTTGKTYYYKIRAYAIGDAEYLYSPFTSVVSAAPKLGTPGSVKAASASYNSVKISWSSVPGATGYVVYRYKTASASYERIKVTSSTSYTNTGLLCGVNYYYKVRAYRTVNGTNLYGNPSGSVSAAPVLGVPGNFRGVRSGDTSIKLSWSAVSGASGYVIYRYKTSSGSYERIKVTTSTSYTNTGLSKTANYYYKIRAYRTVSGSNIYGNVSDSIKIAGIQPLEPDIHTTYIIGETDSDCYVVGFGIRNDGSKTLRIYSTGANLYDDDYYYYDRDLVLIDTNYFDTYGVIRYIDYVDIPAGSSYFVSFAVIDPPTWYDAYSKIYFAFKYDNVVYHAYVSYNYGSKYW